MSNQFSILQQRAIALLASGINYRQCAIELGITRNLLRKWRDNPQFQTAIELEKKKFISDYKEELSQLKLKAVRTISKLLDDPKLPLDRKISLCFDSLNLTKTIKINYINLD